MYLNQNENETCPAVGFQAATVCVPVSVKPFAEVGPTVTKCCGDPVVESGQKNCQGTKNGECFFTISQEICVAVPVKFGANALVGDTFVECIGASSEEQLCDDCSETISTKSKKKV